MCQRVPFFVRERAHADVWQAIANSDGYDVPTWRDNALESSVLAVLVADRYAERFHLCRGEDGFASPVEGSLMEDRNGRPVVSLHDSTSGHDRHVALLVSVEA